MHEFIKLKNSTINPSQLLQYLRESKAELDCKEKTLHEVGSFFNVIYGLGLTYFEQRRLARFIKKGEWNV